MRTSRRLTAVTTTAATATVLAVLTAFAAPASAATTPGDGPTVTVDGATTTITVDTARLQELCDRVPEAVARLDALVTRIQADAGSPGSAAWLHAQADTARGARRGAAANRMDNRAELRAGRVTNLESAADRLRLLDSSVCSQLGAS
ncbi:hypothetical protein ACTHAM_000890 [Cellulomonas soli]|uniref:hypothetical protein n=1 Tax=Cellulomonas soli TaxID=931535 RepID=UPI003F86B441